MMTHELDEQALEDACRAYWPLHWPKHFAEQDATSIRLNMGKAIRAYLSSTESEKVAVKALEWGRIEDDAEWWGATALNMSWEVRQGRASVRVRTPSHTQFQAFPGDIEEAKAACQANYEHLVRAALASEPANG
jgi:hypothetical protein